MMPMTAMLPYVVLRRYQPRSGPSRLALAALAAFSIVGVCHNSGCQAGVATANGSKRKMKSVDIVPGQSIGTVRLGAKTNELPKDASVTATAGQMDGICFSLVGGVVDDVWIDDIRAFPHELLLGGQPLKRTAPLDDLKKVLGPCRRVDGIKGGAFFNCKDGIALGTDPDEAGVFVQMRLKPR